MTINFAELRKPFKPEEIEWRIGQAGKKGSDVWAKAFAYVTVRAIMQRLDEVCGPGNWCNEFSPPPNAQPGTATLCTIRVRVDGEWVGKTDGAENSDMEATKGGLSDSMKRAAVQWGIGRYLYDLEEKFVETSMERKNGWRYQSANDRKGTPAFYWKDPELPAWALPGGVKTTTKPEPQPEIPPQSEKYKSGLSALAKANTLAAIKKLADGSKKYKIEQVITSDEHKDLDAKIATKAVELCKTLADCDSCEHLLHDMHQNNRLAFEVYSPLATTWGQKKDALDGAAA